MWTEVESPKFENYNQVSRFRPKLQKKNNNNNFINSSPLKLGCFATLCHFSVFLSLNLNPKFEIFLLLPLFRFAPFFFYHQTLVTSTHNQKPSFFLFQWVVYHYGIGWQAPFPCVKSWTCGYLSTFHLVCNFFLNYLIWLLHLFTCDSVISYTAYIR